MTSAPLAQQRRLIELQALDSALSRLAHERRSLPVLATIGQTVESLKANHRATVLAQAELARAREDAQSAERDVEQVVTRATVLRERLHSGAASARDLPAIQSEIDQLGQRQATLEEAQLAAVEALEKAQGAVDSLAKEELSIREAGRALTATRDAEFARIDQEVEATQERRHALACDLPQELVDTYDEVRARTGGLGAVALYGKRVDGPVELSPQELARVLAAPADEVVHAEDGEVIVVRMSADEA